MTCSVSLLAVSRITGNNGSGELGRSRMSWISSMPLRSGISQSVNTMSGGWATIAAKAAAALSTILICDSPRLRRISRNSSLVCAASSTNSSRSLA